MSDDIDDFLDDSAPLEDRVAQVEALKKALQAELSKSIHALTPDETELAKQFKKFKSLLEATAMRNRQLVGAKKMMKGRPMSDLSKRIKKKQRKAVLGALIKFKRAMKSQQKGLVKSAVKEAKLAYKKHHG